MSLIYGGISWDSTPDDQKVSTLKEELGAYPTDEYHSINSDGISAGLYSIRLRKHPFPKDQIIKDEVNDLILVADARLDYREDLVAKLGLPIDSIYTSSDPQLLLCAFNKWGKKCLDHLEGDYVFLVYNLKNKEAWVARDPVGLRPLFFIQASKQMYFSTSLKGLLRLKLFADQVNEDFWLNRLLSLDCSPLASPHKNIHQIPIGHEVLIKPDSHETKRFFWWKRDVKKEKGKDYEAELKDILEKAVETRLYPDYEIGGNLSGGLDSSAVMAIASQKLSHRDKKKKIWTVSSVAKKFQNHPFDERPWVEHFCSHFSNVDSACFTADDDPKLEIAHKNLFAQMRFRRYSNFFIDRKFQKHLENHNCKTILTGWRGDHYISRGSGYALNELLLKGDWKYFMRNFNKIKKWKKISSTRLVKSLIKRNMPSAVPTFPAIDLLNQEWVALHAHRLKEKVAKESKWGKRDMQWDFDHFLPQNGKEFLFYMEDTSFLNEKPTSTLHPLSDRRVISYAVNLPAIEYERDGMDRSLFRRSLKGVLPERIRFRQNKGYYNFQEKEQIKSLVSDLLANHRGLLEKSTLSSYINVKEVLATIDDYLSRKDSVVNFKIADSLNIIGYLIYFTDSHD
ncbi:MAG: lasso peptide isopeptide bond-forming cyclase [Roseivirga sp.]